MRLSPFGPTEGMRLQETLCLIALHRFDEARVANERMIGIQKTGWRLNLELAAGRFAVAESIARANLRDPSQQDVPDYPWECLARARFGRGALHDADEALDGGLDILRRAHDPWVPWYPRARAEFSVVSDGAVSLLPETADADTSVHALITRGLVAATRRDAVTARRCLGALHRRPRRDLAFELVGVPLLEARVAAMAGRPEEAVRLLRPFDGPHGRRSVSITWSQWWLADAFEQMGRPDSAAWYLERLERSMGSPDDGTEAPYVHRRLALLDVKLGRVADAERNLAAAEQAWDQPDPAVRRMLDEARTAVRAARAMSPPKR